MARHAEPDNIVRLTTESNPALAHILHQALADAGIKSKVVGDYLAASVGDIPGLYPEVWVHKQDLARAQEVLERHQKAREEASPEEAEE